MKNNILVLSIGGKVPLVKAVKSAAIRFELNVIGTDMSDKAIASYFVDSFELLPKIDNLDCQYLISFCKQKNIGYIIPTRDADVVYLAKYKKSLNEEGINVFCCEERQALLCMDKLSICQSYKYFNFINTSENIDDIDSQRYVVKERFGAGSNNIILNVEYNYAIKCSKNISHPIFQPFVEGQEYSVDAYVNKNGKAIAVICRSRDLVVNGESKITTYKKVPVLEEKIKNILETINIYGHSVTQVIENNGEYFIVEINPRFGGASTLSLAMGMDSFYWFLCESINKNISFKLNEKKLRQVRYMEDLYVEC